ncbi:MAG: sulfurtransferase FdhD, partial [Pelagibacterales bacterium]|nr:sulfurtransferase FdhD [Pelagibacterales bacterium]
MIKNLSVKPDIYNQNLIKEVEGLDESGNYFKQNVVMERPLTIFLNKQEVVTSMTVGDHPEWMAVGFLVNQGMLSAMDNITSVDLDWDIEVIVVRTENKTN